MRHSLLRHLSTLRAASQRPLLHDVAVHLHGRTAAATLPLTVAHLPDLRGHFPNNPIVPAVFILDAMFRLARELPGERNRHDQFDFVRSAKFRRVVTPKDHRLSLEVQRLGPDAFKGLAFVSSTNQGRRLAAEAEFGNHQDRRSR